MSERFVIQEIVTQDWSGVLFRAVDMKSGKSVGLHRFFPFGLVGVEAEGLSGDEREEYRAGMQQMAEFSHPAFRTVFTGGCDPVDGVPFVVTEWIEGESLAQLMVNGPLEPDTAFELFNQALLLCEALSSKLGSEALWVSMLPEMIVLDTGKQSRGFTFGLSPNRWLVESRERRSLKPMANLLDYVMGWSGRMVGAQMGGGLGGWVKWLRGPGQSASLAEARRALERVTGREAEIPLSQAPAASPAVPASGGEPAPVGTPQPTAPAPAVAHPPVSGSPLPAPTPVRHAPLPAGALTGSSAPGKGMWIAMALLVLVIGGVLAWVGLRPGGAGDSGGKSGQAPAPASSAADRASARAAELAVQVQRGEVSALTEVSETDTILAHKDQEITVEGEVTAVRLTRTGKTLFVEFRNAVARGRVITADAAADLTAETLRGFTGKRVRLTGTVKVVAGKPVIDFNRLAAIKKAP